MKLSIYRCVKCNKTRLVDKVGDQWICFACKQHVKKPELKEKPVEIKAIKKKRKVKKKK